MAALPLRQLHTRMPPAQHGCGIRTACVALAQEQSTALCQTDCPPLLALITSLARWQPNDWPQPGSKVGAASQAQPQSWEEDSVREEAWPTCPVWAAICIHVSRAAFLWRRRLLSEGSPIKSLGVSLQGSTCSLSLSTDHAHAAAPLLCLRREPTRRPWVGLGAPGCAPGPQPVLAKPPARLPADRD